MQFICDNKRLFKDVFVRKSQRVFLQMSFIITTRNAEQCRTHHQKMVKFHGSVDKVISHHKSEFPSTEPMAVKMRKVVQGKNNKQNWKAEKQGYRMEVHKNNLVVLQIFAGSILGY